MRGALSLLARRNLDQISIDDIARASDVSVGAIYRRFENREALVLELLRRVQVRQLDALDEELAEARWAGKGIDARIDWLAARQSSAVEQAPGLVRAIIQSVFEGPVDPTEESVRMNSDLVAKVTAWLIAPNGRVGASDRAYAEVIVAQFLIGLNMALVHPSAFAPHATGTASSALRIGLREGLRKLERKGRPAKDPDRR